MSAAEIKNSNDGLYAFDDLDEVKMAIPAFPVKLNKLCVYVRPKGNANYVLLRCFSFTRKFPVQDTKRSRMDLLCKMLDSWVARKAITSADNFWNKLGFRWQDAWKADFVRMNAHRLYSTESLSPLIVRLVEELGISALSEQYRVFTSRFRLTVHPVFDYLSIQLQLNQDAKYIRNVNDIRCFRNCTYKLRDVETGTEQKADYNHEIIIDDLSELSKQLKYAVSVVEPRLLGQREPVFLQTLRAEIKID